MSSNVPSRLFRNSWAGPFSTPTNRSRKPSLSMSVQTAVCVVVGTARPLATVTSVNVPSQLFRRRDLRCARSSHPPRRIDNVGAAIVVVVAVHRVQPAKLGDETGLRRPVGERAVAVVAEQAHGAALVGRGRDDVKAAGVAEVLDEDTAGQSEADEPGLRRDIAEPSDVLGGLKCRQAESDTSAGPCPGRHRARCRRGSTAISPRARQVSARGSAGSARRPSRHRCSWRTTARAGDGADRNHRASRTRRCPSRPCGGSAMPRASSICSAPAGT